MTSNRSQASLMGISNIDCVRTANKIELTLTKHMYDVPTALISLMLMSTLSAFAVSSYCASSNDELSTKSTQFVAVEAKGRIHMPDIQKDCADSRVDKLRYSNHESRNENSQGPSAISINSKTAMLFRRRRRAQEVSASPQPRSLISTSAYAVCVYCTFRSALDVAIEWLRLLSTQQPTTRVAQHAVARENP